MEQSDGEGSVDGAGEQSEDDRYSDSSCSWAGRRGRRRRHRRRRRGSSSCSSSRSSTRAASPSPERQQQAQEGSDVDHEPDPPARAPAAKPTKAPATRAPARAAAAAPKQAAIPTPTTVRRSVGTWTKVLKVSRKGKTRLAHNDHGDDMHQSKESGGGGSRTEGAGVDPNDADEGEWPGLREALAESEMLAERDAQIARDRTYAKVLSRENVVYSDQLHAISRLELARKREREILARLQALDGLPGAPLPRAWDERVEILQLREDLELVRKDIRVLDGRIDDKYRAWYHGDKVALRNLLDDERRRHDNRASNARARALKEYEQELAQLDARTQQVREAKQEELDRAHALGARQIKERIDTMARERAEELREAYERAKVTGPDELSQLRSHRELRTEYFHRSHVDSRKNNPTDVAVVRAVATRDDGHEPHNQEPDADLLGKGQNSNDRPGWQVGEAAMEPMVGMEVVMMVEAVMPVLTQPMIRMPPQARSHPRTRGRPASSSG